jgi:hypothetical protein
MLELLVILYNKKESKAQFAVEVPLQDPSFAPCPCSQKTN